MSDRRNSGGEPDDKPSENLKYKGVRKRKWGKWVSEIRLPNSRDRIWLGTYDKPEKAARAFDAAQFCLRGPHGKFNFPDTPPDIPGAHRLSPREIQAAAAKFAADHGGDDGISVGGCSSNALAGEHSEERDGGGVWPELDVLDGGSDFAFDNTIMSGNEMIYDSEIFFAVQGEGYKEEDEDFCHESNFLWNFDNHQPYKL